MFKTKQWNLRYSPQVCPSSYLMFYNSDYTPHTTPNLPSWAWSSAGGSEALPTWNQLLKMAGKGPQEGSNKEYTLWPGP